MPLANWALPWGLGLVLLKSVNIVDVKLLLLFTLQRIRLVTRDIVVTACNCSCTYTCSSLSKILCYLILSSTLLIVQVVLVVGLVGEYYVLLLVLDLHTSRPTIQLTQKTVRGTVMTYLAIS